MENNKVRYVTPFRSVTTICETFGISILLFMYFTIICSTLKPCHSFPFFEIAEGER